MEQVEENHVPQQNRYKRKRKKNFLQNARKYGKKGCYGRGVQLDPDTYQYFLRILEAYKEGFPNDEEKKIFVNNVFQQTENQELTCCSNQVGCRVIQMLLPFANNQAIERYMQVLSSDMRPLCSDPFASHVLQTLLEVSCRKSLQPEEDEFSKQCEAFTLKISKFLLNNLEDYIWDTYGNHVMRTVLKTLAQLECEDKDADEPPEEYTEVVKNYAQRLIAWPQFKDLPFSELTSGFLQTLLRVLGKVDVKLLKTYLKKLLNECFINVTEMEESKDEEKTQQKKLKDVFMSKPALMLMETALELATPKLYTQMYAKYFINDLALLSITRSSNFCVQKLINHCKEKVEFEAIFDELMEQFKEICQAGHSGIILSLARACKRLCTKQSSFIQSIMKCFNCYEPEERQLDVVLCLCTFTSFEDLNQETLDLQKTKLNLHGTLIVQLMLEFNKPIKVVNSVLNMSATQLKHLFSNGMGSHIIDSYMQSKFIGEKNREKLLRRMQGTYQDLAASKYGSRSFEAIWNVANLKNKLSIMSEISYKDGSWSNSEFGKIISCKVNLALYKRNVEEWKNDINKVSKKQELFADIIDK